MTIRNRELSQFGSFVYIDNNSQEIGIATESVPYVGIGTTNPTKKFHVVGDTLTDGNSNVVGYVSATSYYLNGNPLVDAAVEKWADGSGSDIYRLNGDVGIGTTDPSYKLDVTGDINLTGDLYQNGTLFSGSNWTNGTGDDVYKLTGNVGIGTSVLTDRLVVKGNVSAGQFISTTLTGTAPFSVQSETVVTNLNAFYLRGGVPGQDINSYDIVTRGGSQTLSNKTLTSPIITSIQVGVGSIQTLPTGTGSIVSTNSVGLVTTGMIANNTIINGNIAAGAGITYGKLNLSNSITGSDIVNGTIGNSKLQNSTISGVSLGSTLGTLTFGTYLQASGSSYNGSTNVSIALSASSLNNPNAVVVRDGSGNFAAGTITASLTGNATGLSGTPNLNVGIVTGTTVNVGNTRISSGIVTASSGIVTYYGDASGLSNIPSSGISTVIGVGTTVWTKPSTGSFALVTIWGGGGGGGKARWSATGGGGGSCIQKIYRLSDLPSTVTITVGAGGSGSSALASGYDGSPTTFNDTVGGAVTAYGGAGGQYTTSSGASLAGGGGGGTLSAGSLGIGGDGHGRINQGGSSTANTSSGTSDDGDFGGAAGGYVVGVSAGVGRSAYPAGRSWWGGGGGGAAGDTVGDISRRTSTGGVSLNGGKGGDGVYSTTLSGNAGATPGGGGGALVNILSGVGNTSGKGGDGRCTIYIW